MQNKFTQCGATTKLNVRNVHFDDDCENDCRQNSLAIELLRKPKGFAVPSLAKEMDHGQHSRC